MMKVVIIGLICLILGVNDAVSQGRILITSRDSTYAFAPWHQSSLLPKLQSALTQHYKGEVTTHFGLLPDALNIYDAIFIDLQFYGGDDSVIVAKELAKLSGFLLEKGKVYIEISSSSLWHDLIDTSFLRLTGLLDMYSAAAVIKGIDHVQGVPSRFTAAIDYHIKTNPTVENAPEILFLEGELDTVLTAGGNFVPVLGWQHEKENRKVIWHWPIVSDHYEEFIGRVVCDYFGLCDPLVVTRSQTITCRISFDPMSNSINIENASPSASVELYSVLGVKLLNTQVGSGVVKVPDLPRGSYFVVVRDGAGGAITAPILR